MNVLKQKLQTPAAQWTEQDRNELRAALDELVDGYFNADPEFSALVRDMFAIAGLPLDRWTLKAMLLGGMLSEIGHECR